MEGFTYQELAERVNDYFRDKPVWHVSARTLKFWVKSGLLPEPKGTGRWRYFDADDFQEVISLRKLQIYYDQSIEDIKTIIFAVDLCAKVEKFPSQYHLTKFLSALVNSKRHCTPVEEIESFKKYQLHLVYDDAYSPPYRMLDDNEFPDSYIEEDGKVYRILDSIEDESGNAIYFKPEHLEEHLKQNAARSEAYLKPFGKTPKPVDIKGKADEIKALIDAGIINTPRFRFKGGNYLSETNIWTAQEIAHFRAKYRLSVAELKHLRKRIDDDIEHYFCVPEISPYFDPIYYKFRRQVTFFDSCIYALSRDLFVLEESPGDHTKEDSQRLIKAYLNGFYFFCSSFSNDLESIYLSKTPINRLSPEQIKTGLAEGRFTRKEVEEFVSAKEADLKALKSIVKKK